MTAEEIREQIVWVINSVHNPDVLYDMSVLIRTVYKHYKDGNWGK